MENDIVMKKLLPSLTLMLFVLACSLFTPRPTPSVADIEKEEQAIYSFFVGANEGTVLILQETSTNISSTDPKDIRDNIMSGFKNISRETVNSYLERNAKPSQLSPDMDLGVEYALLTSEELSKITSQPNWHEILNEKYPGSGGYTIFSRVGFNNTLDQAVVYVGQVQGPLMGTGFYNLLEKQDGEWKLMDQIMVWIS
jgi:hypothetical protein